MLHRPPASCKSYTRCIRAPDPVYRIGLRAMQGVGGGGMYSMAMVIMSEAVPVPKFPKYTSIISAVFSLAYLVGPLMGGGINNHTTWRWVFLLK